MISPRVTKYKKAHVLLFKPSGKYYTEENWAIPETVPCTSDCQNREAGHRHSPIGPYDMKHSPDFRRIDGGAVLVSAQEPWGFPHLFPSEGN